jgi:cold shock CspA family protein
MKFEGTVLYVKHDDMVPGRFFGFITPLGCNGNIDREQNVWFGPKELDGESVEKGDVVSYLLDEGPRKHQGPRARVKSVRVLHEADRPEIFTHRGADEYI